MKKQKKKWAVFNPKTNKVAWLNTGSKKQAVFATRREAREALMFGETCLNGQVKKLGSYSSLS